MNHSLDLLYQGGEAVEEKIEMGKIYFGMEASVRLTVHNNGPIAINWTSARAKGDEIEEESTEKESAAV